MPVEKSSKIALPPITNSTLKDYSLRAISNRLSRVEALFILISGANLAEPVPLLGLRGANTFNVK